MAPQVSQRPGAKIPPRSTITRMIGWMIRTHRGRSDPKIPIERSRYGRRFLRTVDLDPLRPDRPIRPCVNLADRSDCSVPNPLAKHPYAVARMPLVAHLGDDFALSRRFGEQPGLIDTVRQRLLDIDMLAALDGRHADDSVCVIRRGDDYRVDIFLLVEHHAKIFVDDRLGVPGDRLGGVAPGVYVAESHD